MLIFRLPVFGLGLLILREKFFSGPGFEREICVSRINPQTLEYLKKRDGILVNTKRCFTPVKHINKC